MVSGKSFSEDMAMRPSVETGLTAGKRSKLERLARRREVQRGLPDRVRNVLLTAEGLTNAQIGKVLEAAQPVRTPSS